jgi:hypothetical protein
MLSAVNLYGDSRICAQEIYFHSSPTVERNGQIGVQLESASCLDQRVQSSIEERLGGAPRAIGTFCFWRNRTGGGDEQVREWRVNPISNESTHAGSVVAFPERISRQRHACGPARNGARRKDNRIADGLIAATPAIEHSRQHGHVQVGVIVDPYLTFAIVEAMQPADVLRDRPSP